MDELFYDHLTVSVNDLGAEYPKIGTGNEPNMSHVGFFVIS